MKHSKLGRLLSLLLALALMLGVLPTAAHAEEAPYTTITDIGSPHLFANGTRVDHTLLADWETRLFVEVDYQTTDRADGYGYSVALYDIFDGQETQIAVQTDATSPITDGSISKTGTPAYYFDWNTGAAGEHTLKAVVTSDDGTQRLESSTAVTVLADAPDGFIPVHQKFATSNSLTAFLYGWRINGAEVAGYSVETAENGDRTTQVLLSHQTLQDAALTIECDAGPVDNAALVTTAKTVPAQRIRNYMTVKNNGVAVSLAGGSAECILYVYPNATAQAVPQLHTFRFSIAAADDSGDPAPEDVTGLTVTAPPAKTSYVAGEAFERGGMIVTATLRDGSTAPVSGYTCTPGEALSLGDTQVVISFGSASTTVPIRVVPDTTISDVVVANGQLLHNLKYRNGTITVLENTYRAITLYGEETGNFTFRVHDQTEVYVNGEKQAVAADGICSVRLPSGNQYDYGVDGITTTVKITGAGAYSDVSTEYSFICYQQLYSGMPTAVVEYLCIGSQYTNVSPHGPYGLNGAATLRGELAAGTTTGSETTGPTSLGNFGGYITYYYEKPIVDNPCNPYGVDMLIIGNSYNATNGFAEPGQVWVSEDGERWYALAGSAHYDDLCVWDYAVTYNDNSTWSDSLGNSGSGRTYGFPNREYYPLFDWPEEEVTSLTMSGIHLKAAAGTNEYGNTLPPSTSFGYVDCGDTRVQDYADNPYIQTPGRVDGFDLAWAVDTNGQPVDVSDMQFHYVKIQTAAHIVNAGIGEKSTEVQLMRTVQAAEQEVGKTEAPTAITVDGKALTLQDGVYVYNVEVSGGFNVEVTAPEDANVYINSNYSRLVTFYAIPDHKMVRIIIQSGEKEPVIYYVNLTESETKQETTTLTLDANGGYHVPAGMSTEYINWERLQQEGQSTMQYVFDEGMHNAVFPKPYRAGYTFAGWVYDQKVYTAYTPELQDGATLTAAWDVQTPSQPEEDITVSFRLIGCTRASGNVDLNLGDAGYYGAEYVTWIATRDYTVPADAVVLTVFEKALTEAGLTWENPSGGYITSITAPELCGGYALSEMTNGGRSGWMYTLNGEHATNGVAAQTLQDQDVIVFHYVNDYSYEVHDWGNLGGTGYPGETDSTYHSKWLEALDVDPEKLEDLLAANKVVELIDAIGEVTLDSGAAISAAREAYDALTDAQKELVPNASVLLEAEAVLTHLQDCANGQHTYGAWELVTKADCTQEGLMERICQYCGNADQLKLAALGHHLEEGTVTKEPTCTESGLKCYTCAVCGEAVTESIAKLPHSYADTVTVPTCEAGGYTTHTCTVCGHSYVDAMTSAAGHTYTTVVTAPTCETGGYTTHTCTVCGHSYIDAPTPAAGHTFASAVTAPTCDKMGYTTHTCADCGYSYVDSYVAALEHRYESEVTKEATCTAEGVRTFTCTDCGKTYTASIPMTAHSYEARTTAPDCTHMGYTVYTCSVCGDSCRSDFVDAAGHDFVSTEHTPTCEGCGYTENACTRCDFTYISGITQPTGHTFGEWETRAEATCFADGIETHACTVCGATEERALAANSTHCPSKEFTDVDIALWYHKGIDYVVSNGLMNGMGNGKFEPEGTLTRAQLVTTLWRMAGEPEADEKSPFTDVTAGIWYAEAVAWANSKGITTGVTATAFAPDAPVTREQLVTFLYRYAGEPTVEGNLDAFPDAAQVSGYAADAMTWAVSNGILNGMDGRLAPQGTATRAQIAAILMRYLEA